MTTTTTPIPATNPHVHTDAETAAMIETGMAALLELEKSLRQISTMVEEFARETAAANQVGDDGKAN